MPLPFSLTMRRLLLLLAGALAGCSAGCQSARSAYQFQPAARAMTTPKESRAPMRQTTRANTAPTEPFAPSVPHESGPRQGQQRERLIQAQRPAAPEPSAPKPLVKANVRRLAASGPVATRRVLPKRTRPAAAVAESGLGTMFVGILGIVALLVGLVGLLVGGGAFFGLLATGGALALLYSIVVPVLMGWGG